MARDGAGAVATVGARGEPPMGRAGGRGMPGEAGGARGAAVWRVGVGWWKKTRASIWWAEWAAIGL